MFYYILFAVLVFLLCSVLYGIYVVYDDESTTMIFLGGMVMFMLALIWPFTLIALTSYLIIITARKFKTGHKK